MLQRPFANVWLNRAVLWELLVLNVVLYVPGLNAAFGTFPLSLLAWGIVVSAALTVVPVLEGGK